MVEDMGRNIKVRIYNKVRKRYIKQDRICQIYFYKGFPSMLDLYYGKGGRTYRIISFKIIDKENIKIVVDEESFKL